MGADTCCIANQHCRAPANLSPAVPARAKCYSCGEAVCAAPGCSVRTEYRDYGKQRICAHCLDQRALDDPGMERGLRQLYREMVQGADYHGEACEAHASQWERVFPPAVVEIL
jgi:hypothetical protein